MKINQLRYSRQTNLPFMNVRKQRLLAQKIVALVGVGGLGSPAAELLARIGIGKLLIVDSDIIQIHNLPRQFLFTEKDVGKKKAETAKKKLLEINSQLKIEFFPKKLTEKNIYLLKRADLILDCTDNLATRFLINDFCKKEKIPWVFAAALRTKGLVLPLFPKGPCLRCFLKEAELEKCLIAGVLNTITVSIAALQVTLALKILLKEKVKSELYQYELWQPQLKILQINKHKNCPLCGKKKN